MNKNKSIAERAKEILKAFDGRESDIDQRTKTEMLEQLYAEQEMRKQEMAQAQQGRGMMAAEGNPPGIQGGPGAGAGVHLMASNIDIDPENNPRGPVGGPGVGPAGIPARELMGDANVMAFGSDDPPGAFTERDSKLIQLLSNRTMGKMLEGIPRGDGKATSDGLSSELNDITLDELEGLANKLDASDKFNNTIKGRGIENIRSFIESNQDALGYGKFQSSNPESMIADLGNLSQIVELYGETPGAAGKAGSKEEIPVAERRSIAEALTAPKTKGLDLGDPLSFTEADPTKRLKQADIPTFWEEPGLYAKYGLSKAYDKGIKPALNWADKNGAFLSTIAGPLASMFDSPLEETPTTMRNKARAHTIDSTAIKNAIENQGATSRYAMEQAGLTGYGDYAKAAAGVGQDTNRAITEALMNADQFNAQQKTAFDQAQQGVEQFNAQQRAQTQTNNIMNKAATIDAKRDALGAMSQSLGNLYRERDNRETAQDIVDSYTDTAKWTAIMQSLGKVRGGNGKTVRTNTKAKGGSLNNTDNQIAYLKGLIKELSNTKKTKKNGK